MNRNLRTKCRSMFGESTGLVTLFYTLASVKKGAELTYDYGVSFWLASGQRPSEGTDSRRELD